MLRVTGGTESGSVSLLDIQKHFKPVAALGEAMLVQYSE